jgi:hypothetical protein
MPGYYLAERYWPGVDEATAREAVRRFALEAASDDGVTTTILTSTFVPPEEAVLLLVRAGSKEDVADVGRRADLAFDRIVEVVVLEGNG